MSVKYFPLDLQNKIENGTCCIKFGVRDINDADIEEDIYLYLSLIHISEPTRPY